MNPDFDEWSKRILDRSDVAEALKQAFEQGWSAGYMDGQEHGWVDALESDGNFLSQHTKNQVEHLVEGVDFDINKRLEEQEDQGC